MENQDINLFALNIDEKSKLHIRGMIMWATIIVICSVIGYLINIYDYLKPAAALGVSEADYEQYYKNARRAESTVSLFIGLLIGVMITAFLWNFTRYAKKGIENSSNVDLSRGFMNLKNYFLVLGIVFILFILLVLFILVSVGSLPF